MENAVHIVIDKELDSGQTFYFVYDRLDGARAQLEMIANDYIRREFSDDDYDRVMMDEVITRDEDYFRIEDVCEVTIIKEKLIFRAQEVES